MDLSIKWLKEFVDIDYKPREFAEALTMSGSKVEGYRKEGEDISGVVIGKINSIEKHPNAEKLVISQVRHSRHGLTAGMIPTMRIIV